MSISWERFDEAATTDPEGATQRLRQDLFAFANRNKQFKCGDLDFWSFAIEGRERTDPLLDLIEPQNQFEFSFSVQRQRSLHTNLLGEITGYAKNWSFFTLAMRHKLAGIDLPEHIAEDQIGLPAEEAREEIGPVTLERCVRIGLRSDVNLLMTCESFLYYGEDPYEDDGTIVYSNVCNCPQPHDEDGWWNYTEHDDEESLVIADDTDLTLLKSSDLVYPNTILTPIRPTENLIVSGADHVISLWEQSDSLAKMRIGFKDPYVAELGLAFGALNQLRKSLDGLMVG